MTDLAVTDAPVTDLAVADLTTAEARALAAVDRDGAVDLLLGLLAIPSTNGSDAEAEIQHVLAAELTHLDLDVDLWPLDVEALAADPAFPGWEVPRTEAWGLVGTAGGYADPPALILQGHVDVVPPGDPRRWRGDPFVPYVSGGSVHGRGACDMKAGVVANIIAVRAIRAAGVELDEGFALHLVVGEEDGGLGAFGTLRRGHTGRACIITEPTSGTLTTANAGALTFRIAVPGAATHASTSYAGTSAIEVFLPVYAALQELQTRRNANVEPLMREYPVPYPLSIGTVRAGDWASSVPDLLVAEGRLGVGIDEDPVEARAELEVTVREASEQDPWLRKHPVVLTWPGGQFTGGRFDSASGVGDTVRAAHATVTGTGAPRERGAPYGSDLRLYAAAGIPTLHYGPGDVRLAHGPEESVMIRELIATTETLILTMLRSCLPR